MACFHGTHKSQLSREPNHFFDIFFTSNYSSLIIIRVPFVVDKSCKYFPPNDYIFLVGVVFFYTFLPNFRIKRIVLAIMLRLENHYDQYKDYTSRELLDEMVLQMDIAFDYTTNLKQTMN